MHHTHRRARFAPRVLVVPAALGILAAGAPLAAAHTDLDSSTPAAEASLAEVPESVTLTFSDPMSQKYAKVAVTGPDEQPAGRGTPQVDGKRVTVALGPRGQAGTYSVGYRVVSADGHPVSGSYTFTVRAPVVSSPRPTAAPPEPSASPSPASASPLSAGGGDPAGAGPAVVTAAGVLAAAAVAGCLVFRRRRAGRGD